jgi:hypothetical protein
VTYIVPGGNLERVFPDSGIVDFLLLGKAETHKVVNCIFLEHQLCKLLLKQNCKYISLVQKFMETFMAS